MSGAGCHSSLLRLLGDQSQGDSLVFWTPRENRLGSAPLRDCSGSLPSPAWQIVSCFPASGHFLPLSPLMAAEWDTQAVAGGAGG